MSAAKGGSKISSWADEVENDDVNQDVFSLPEPSTVTENGMKIVTEYGIDDDGKKFKCVRYFKIDKRMVSKTVAARKKWAKFGDSKSDPPGPNPATTVIAEDVFMQFISSKEEDNKTEEDGLADKLKNMGDKGVVKCRICGSDHWTANCPYKDTDLATGEFFYFFALGSGLTKGVFGWVDCSSKTARACIVAKGSYLFY